MKKLAVIGLGHIAIRHRHNLKQLFPEADIYAMSASGRPLTKPISDCDVLVSSVDELIKNQVELAVIASPAPFHAKHALPLIKAGIPTLIEKPVVADSQDIELLQQAIDQYHTPVAVGYCLRYLSSAPIVHQLLAEKKIGKIYNAFIQVGQYLPDWRPNKKYQNSVSASLKLGGGVLLELSHELDYTQWLLGELNVEHVLLRSSEDLGLVVEDIADITITTQAGVVGHVHLDFLQRKAHRVCSFIGNQGRLDWDLIQNKVDFVSAKGVQQIYSAPEWDKNQMYLEMVEDFIELIKNRKNRCVLLDEAAQTIYLIEHIKYCAIG